MWGTIRWIRGTAARVQNSFYFPENFDETFNPEFRRRLQTNLGVDAAGSAFDTGFTVRIDGCKAPVCALPNGALPVLRRMAAILITTFPSGSAVVAQAPSYQYGGLVHTQ